MRTILGLYRIYGIYIGIMEKNMETTIKTWGIYSG